MYKISADEDSFEEYLHFRKTLVKPDNNRLDCNSDEDYETFVRWRKAQVENSDSSDDSGDSFDEFLHFKQSQSTQPTQPVDYVIEEVTL